MSKEIEKVVKEIEQAKSNILRGIDIESSGLILEKAILDGYIFTGGRIDILKLATRQILYFIENSKVRNNIGDKDILDYVKENVKLKEENEANKKKIEELEEENKIYRKQLNSAFDRGFIHRDKIEEIIQKLDVDIERNNRAKEEVIKRDLEGRYVNHIIAYKPEIIKQILEELLKDGGE